MNRYILVLVIGGVLLKASDEPLSTSSDTELSFDKAVVNVLYCQEADVIKKCHVIIKINSLGIDFLRSKNAPLRVSVSLDRRQEKRFFDENCKYRFVHDDTIDLAIRSDAIDFSIKKELHAIIKEIPACTILSLSCSLSQQKALLLDFYEGCLEEKYAQEASNLSRLQRFISQYYKG